MNHKHINTKLLLFLSLISIMVVYSQYFPLNKIVNFVLDEYILLFIIFVLLIGIFFQKLKIKGNKTLIFIPNINSVELKSTLVFFLIFEVIDFYYEDGFIGMISLWFTYWCFGLLAYILTLNINLYKNLRFYKYNNKNY